MSCPGYYLIQRYCTSHLWYMTSVILYRAITIQRSVEKIIGMTIEGQPANLIDRQACQYFRQHYFNLTVEALTNAITKSFTALLHRLQPASSNTKAQVPLLELGILLSMPSIVTTPSLEDAQTALASLAEQVSWLLSHFSLNYLSSHFYISWHGLTFFTPYLSGQMAMKLYFGATWDSSWDCTSLWLGSSTEQIISQKGIPTSMSFPLSYFEVPVGTT